MYRSCEDILEGVKPLLAETNTTLILTDDIHHVGDRYYIRSKAILMNAEGGAIAMAEAYAREQDSKKGMDAAQVTGASSSYSRKYALNGLFCSD